MRSYSTAQTRNSKASEGEQRDCITWQHLELILGALAFLVTLKALVNHGQLFELGTPLTWVLLGLSLVVFGHGLKCWRRSLKRLRTPVLR